MTILYQIKKVKIGYTFNKHDFKRFIKANQLSNNYIKEIFSNNCMLS